MQHLRRKNKWNFKRRNNQFDECKTIKINNVKIMKKKQSNNFICRMTTWDIKKDHISIVISECLESSPVSKYYIASSRNIIFNIV